MCSTSPSALVGGTLDFATLPRYPVAKDQPDVLVVQLLSTRPANYGTVQTGLRKVGAAAGEAEPTHLATFTAERLDYELGDGDTLVVPLSWAGADGVTVTKNATRLRAAAMPSRSSRSSNNAGAAPWRGAEYAQIQRVSGEQERSMLDVDSYSFVGPIIYDGKKSEKLDHEDLQEEADNADERRRLGRVDPASLP